MTRELTIDPELRDYLPNHEDDALLEKQLVSEGCRDPIVVWANHDDTVIDGNRRYRLCTKNNIQFKTVAMTFPDKAAVMEWMWDNQGNRRNVTPQDLKLARARLYEAKKGAVGAPKNNAHAEKTSKTPEKNKSANIAVLNSASQVAAKTGVSERTIHNDLKFKEALDKVAPLVRDKIDGKAVKASTAELERLAELPPTKQREVVEAVKNGEAKSLGGAMGPKPRPARADAPLKRSQLDDKGVEVPEALLDVFEARDTFAALQRDLTAIAKRIADLKKTDAGYYVPDHSVGDAKKLATDIADATPSVIDGTDWLSRGAAK